MSNNFVKNGYQYVQDTRTGRISSTNIKCIQCGNFYFHANCPTCHLPTFGEWATNLNKAIQRPGGLYLGNGLIVSPSGQMLIFIQHNGKKHI